MGYPRGRHPPSARPPRKQSEEAQAAEKSELGLNALGAIHRGSRIILGGSRDPQMRERVLADSTIGRAAEPEDGAGGYCGPCALSGVRLSQHHHRRRQSHRWRARRSPTRAETGWTGSDAAIWRVEARSLYRSSAGQAVQPSARRYKSGDRSLASESLKRIAILRRRYSAGSNSVQCVRSRSNVSSSSLASAWL